MALAPGVPGMLLGGCGAGTRANGKTAGASGGSGRATFKIAWPKRSRLIPSASNSIKVEVRQNGALLRTIILDRPADGSPSTALFDPLPAGGLTVTATAYPEAAAGGVALATATGQLVIKVGENTSVTLTMASTITDIYPFGEDWRIPPGATTTMAAYAYNADGDLVLTTPQKLRWESDNPAVAAVDANGVVRGIGIGDANITVTDTESGKSGSTEIGVRAKGIEIYPDSARVTVSSQGDAWFFALDSLTWDIVDVTWRVQEGATGGSIDADGVYTAPATPGTYHVVAALKSDPSQTATATVEVKAQGGLLPKGTPAPEIAGTTIDRVDFKLSGYRGKVVLIDFCATWCPPCSQEVPELIALQNTYAARGFTVVGLYLDGDTTAVPPYVADKGINYPVLLATQEMWDDYGDVGAIPTLYLVDKQGKIAFGQVGYQTQAVLAAQIEALL
jgi:cytochrome c biogenesis protein CcmG/thiol:disulfide interchange protein DsbE